MKKRKSNRYGQRMVSLLAVMLLITSMLGGCGTQSLQESENDKVSSENIVMTETGEIIEIDESEKTDKVGDGLASETYGEPEEFSDLSSTESVDGSETKESSVVETEQENNVDNDRRLQLVFLGDSIFDNSRDGTGVPYLTAVQLEANLYNLAIAGTSASIEDGEEWNVENWTSRSLCGVVYAMAGRIPTDIFEGTNAKAVLDDPDVDFSKTDYFIVEYGLNDYFRGVSRTEGEFANDPRTYAGALRFAINNLRGIAPDATIILCSPHYSRFFDGDWMVGDGNVTDNGNGTLFDYKGTCEAVAGDTNSLFLDTYLGIGIDGYTAEEYLEDGVHLTKAGRQLYADALAKLIINYEKTKNN